mmetsp:Transcript_79476/g.228066  ORF Transcript_79476/g.228066 Transcript_79476/m.228066 type:complete len:315 (+) Transcript_79476:457-1401(+)
MLLAHIVLHIIPGLEQLLETRDGAPAQAGEVVCVVVQKNHEGVVHALLEVPQWQVIVGAPEGVLQLDCHEVDGEGGEHHDPSEYGGPDLRADNDRHHQGSQNELQEQEDGNNLRVWKWEAGVADLLGVEHIHQASGQRLVYTGQDRRRDLERSDVVRFGDQRLHEVDEALHSIESVLVLALPEKEQGVRVQTQQVDGVQGAIFLPRVVEFVQGGTVAETHQSDQSVPELQNLRRSCRLGTPGERDQATHGVVPLTPHHVQKPCAVPEKRQRLPSARAKQQHEHRGDGGPNLTLAHIDQAGVRAEAWAPIVQIEH